MNIKPGTKIFLCKYIIKNLIIMNNDDAMQMDPTNILMIEYINDYEKSLFAVLKVTLRIDVRKKIYILANKRDIKCKLEIDKIGYDVDVENRITNPEPVISSVFSVYFNDDDESIDTSILEKRLNMNDGNDSITASQDINDENYFETQNTIDLYLFNPTLLKASRYSHNAVYTSGTLQNIIGHVLTVSKHDKVLMSRIENTEVYKELLLPANPAYKNLLYLDQYYGLYKTGALIYYDIDVLYILNTNGKVTAKRKNEWGESTFLIPELENSIPGSGMLRQPDEKIFYLTVAEGDVNPQKTSIMKNVDVGSKLKLALSDDTTIDLITSQQSYIDNQNTSVINVKKENKYTGTMLQARLQENEAVIYISGNNLDINAFTPNKTFKIIYDEQSKNTKYKGEYRLAYAYHCIKAESESYSTASHHIILKKTK
jgi:hypothetical protein